MREADLVAIDSLTRLLPPEGSVSTRLLLATTRRDTATVRALETEVPTVTDPNAAWDFLVAMTFMGSDFATAERFARRFTAPERPEAMRRGAHMQLGVYAALRGQWQQARKEFAEARRLGSPSVDYVEASLAARVYLPVSAQERLALRERILQLDSTRLPPFGSGRGTALVEHIRLHAAGSLSAAAGDTAAALRYAAQLERLPYPPELEDAARGLGESLRAQVAWARGDAAATLRILEPLRSRVPVDVFGESRAPWDQMYERYLRAEAHFALGHHDEALRWYDGLPEWSPLRAIFLAPADLRRAEIHERIGNTDRAITHYARFIRLWEECDPALRPQLDYARQRLSALRAAR